MMVSALFLYLQVSKLTIPQQVADIQDLTRQAEAASATEDYDQV